MTVVKLKLEADVTYEQLQSSNNRFGIKLCKQRETKYNKHIVLPDKM